MHLSVAGEIDGKGVHVLDLAAAQARTGVIEPIVVTCPSAEYDHRLRLCELPAVRLVDSSLAPLLRKAHLLGPDRLRVDVVHGHGHHAAYLVALLRVLRQPGWTDVPFVFTCHGFQNGSLLRRIRLTVELHCLRYADAVIVCCTDQVERVRESCPNTPCVYIPNGVPVVQTTVRDAFPSEAGFHKMQAPALTVGAVGRLVREKRHDVFLNVCAVVHRQRPEVRFLLIGEGPERRRLEALARSLDLTDHITFTGMVKDIRERYGDISVLVHTSDSEGMPLVVIEAMAAGIPVVATALDGVRALLDHGVHGLLAERRDIDHLAEHCLALLADERRRQEIGAAASSRVAADFTVDCMRSRVDEVYVRSLARFRPLVGSAIVRPRLAYRWLGVSRHH